MYDPAPYRDVEGQPSRVLGEASDSPRSSIDSTSTTSLILERINRDGDDTDYNPAAPIHREKHGDDDLEGGKTRLKPAERRVRRAVYILGAVMVGAWALALVVYIARDHYKWADNPDSTLPSNLGKTITLDQVMGGNGGNPPSSNSFLEVHDVTNTSNTIVLMQSRSLHGNGQPIHVSKVWPSADLKRVLVASDVQSNWRHSYTAVYWIYDVATKVVRPLVPSDPEARCALAVWSPQGNSIAFVLDNNLYIHQLDLQTTSDVFKVTQITRDGGTELFYGIPDWVYEEEVFSGNKALWWSADGGHLAFLRTNETEVPEYPIQYFVSRPSGEIPEPGQENYPELEFIKYPKAGAPNPVVDLRFYDVEKQQIFSVDIEGDFSDEDRLITEVLWAGGENVLIKETNRESDFLKMALIDVSTRTGKVVREVDVESLDGGWLEVTQNTKYIPADPSKGRKYDGYIDTVIHKGYDHLAYFTPLDNPAPVLLTSGQWEVVDAPSAIDLENGLVYYVSTERSPIERHVYSVKLDGSDKRALTNVSEDGRYDVSFSKLAGYALLTYSGPDIPWQKVVSTQSKKGDSFEKDIEKNQALAKLAAAYALPTFHYSTVNIDGFDLEVVERRPPNFDPKKKYPVLFQVYGGPGSQSVTKSFQIDFQAYIAGALEYIVVTVDGRGTGFIGRKARVAVRDDLGFWEANDQIETAKIWAAKDYVDEERIAIWGWSYGGFMTLKTLEQDAGQTFSYGMAVAPVTDWRFYDSIYTERYMHTPQNNPNGYESSAINNVTAISQNVRFLLMHGIADDNVHLQNSLTLLDKLDLASVENYDVHVFPDSDHSIYFHNANRMVYDRLSQWLIRAFNGEYLKLDHLKPKELEDE
ncbi:uncharacterized protein LAJ45_10882 [Morchella importuna]|uniref:uncharacterized protein n=1 Tax=Morchella importuna TaxID=1174673 RepID=UPI001E8DF62E|nr:uncharacterized protein LAJ45_10882 [Morchella importuna]KAH8145102.1 hypothetical protein LAJ45_10882 [Morchella importuna]